MMLVMMKRWKEGEEEEESEEETPTYLYADAFWEENDWFNDE